jgi:cell cycle checkpoint control protein RAD9A
MQSMHAVFTAEHAKNRWAISSKTLREFVEHFGPRTEQLDIYSEDGRVTFTSYTEKITAGNGKHQKQLPGPLY